jgi:acetyltransferase-like isoleucine patch superfamily enzyme
VLPNVEGSTELMIVVISAMLKRLYFYYLRQTNLKRYAQVRGVRMGHSCKIVGSIKTSFGSEPYLIQMGNHVEISGNVTFITHDGAVWVLREENPNVDVFGRIIIGNNVFVGNGSILLPGTSIGDNTVIGAGALVKGELEANSVYAGVPARRICSFGEYKERALNASLPTKAMNFEAKKRYLIGHFNLD